MLLKIITAMLVKLEVNSFFLVKLKFLIVALTR